MDFNPPSSGEIAYSNSRENAERIRSLELRIAQLEIIVTQLRLNIDATNKAMQIGAISAFGQTFK